MQASNVTTSIDPAKIDQLKTLYDTALEEVINRIIDDIENGKTPVRSRLPEVSIRDNGMPSIYDKPILGGNGPLEYSSVLEPNSSDDAARRQGKFPIARFPALAGLHDFVLAETDIGMLYMAKPVADFLKIIINLSVEGAANTHFQKYRSRPSDKRTRAVVLRPLFEGLTAEWLATPVVIPIALTRFDFARVHLTEDALVIKMSEGLQRARWEDKARASNGHDSVLAAATHALVLKNWRIKNGPKLSLGQELSRPVPEITAQVDSFFAALRLELGIDTGYAQEIRLCKGWRAYHGLGAPAVHAVGARRYPPHFDDYGWMRDDLPLVDRAGIGRVAQTWTALRNLDVPRLNLALRRLNAAMTRDDPADTILDAIIALEVLLGDRDSQSISWKLRMRAAAVVGIDGDKSKMEEMRTAIKRAYEARSAIVHGGKKQSTQSDSGPEAAKVAVDALRAILKQIVANPEYLDPLKIDADLLLTSRASEA